MELFLVLQLANDLIWCLIWALLGTIGDLYIIYEMLETLQGYFFSENFRYLNRNTFLKDDGTVYEVHHIRKMYKETMTIMQVIYNVST